MSSKRDVEAQRETQLLFSAKETPEEQDGYLVGSMRQQDREVSFLHSNQDLKTIKSKTCLTSSLSLG